MENIQITSEGIQKNLKSIKPYDAICEYIWNGFDAGATTIIIKTNKNRLNVIDSLLIEDNGAGIKYEGLNIIFKPFNDSDKYKEREISAHHSLPHGKHGVGRFTFFKFSSEVKWETIYKKGNDLFSYSISMSNQSLNEYNVNDNKQPKSVQGNTGTKVFFSNVVGITSDELKSAIINEFFWFICLYSNNNFTIMIDGSKLDFSSNISKEIDVDFKYGNSRKYVIKAYLWKTGLGKEFSKFYFVNSNGKEVYKENTTLNKKSDNFWHSVFIQSDLFDDFNFEPNNDDQISFSNNRSDDEFKALLQTITGKLYTERKDYLKRASTKYIHDLVENDIYPKFNNNILDSYRKDQLDAIVESLYEAEPKIFTGLNNPQKKIFVRLLNTIMDSSDKDSLFKIIEEVIDLDDNERKDFSELLEKTALSNIISTIKLIEDRLEAVQALKEIVLNKEFNAREVEHVQKIVERHFWLFGEQYHLLTSAEPDFNEALRRLLYFQSGKTDKVKINHEDVNKEMDIFMVRQNKSFGYLENIVVELKRPSVSLGEEQLSQVKSYMRVIISDARFNSPNSQWRYYLIGNKFNKNGYIEGELESNINHGEQGLVYKNKNQKIYVKTWSQIFEEFSVTSDYLLKRLNFSKECWLKKHSNADDAVKDVVNNSARIDFEEIPNK